MTQGEVVHAIPGRLPLPGPELKRIPRIADPIVVAAAHHAGARSVRANRRCASLLIEYAEAVLPRPRPRALVDGWMAAASDGPPAPAGAGVVPAADRPAERLA